VRSPCVFYFDLASPLAYLAAEQVTALVRGPVDWLPVLAGELQGSQSFDAWRCHAEQQAFREDIELRAAALGLQPVRWPIRFPFDSTLAMRVATYARSIGRAVPFAQAAFRQAFAAGRDLEQLDFVLIAAAACEMHPSAVRRGAGLRSVSRELADATAKARRAAIPDVPALRLSPR
jgi:2-hydroxychromene-2-carboxylate isomerase